MADTTAKTCEITLTDRPPVKIVEDDWPVIAGAREDVSSHNATPLPDYECAYWMLYVRQHADGRCVVYGRAIAPEDGWLDQGASNWRGGCVTEAGDDLVAAIHEVGGELVELGGAPGRIVRRCIADLPAEEI